MATKLKIGELVYVPIYRISTYNGDTSVTHIRVEIKDIEKNSVIFFHNDIRHKVSKSFCYRNIGVLLLEIGDFCTEEMTLDPLIESIFSFLKLVVDVDAILKLKVRSLKEINIFWKKHHINYSHVIVVGHGKNDGIFFVTKGEKNNGFVGAKKFMSQFKVKGMSPKLFITLVCKSGRVSFAKEASCSSFCEGIICPYSDVHSAISSQFLQTFIALHFLQGKTLQVAFRMAKKMVVGATNFRFWKNGDYKNVV